MQYMPGAQINCASRIDGLEHIDLGLVVIGYNDHRLNQWAGIPDPLEEKGNCYCRPI